MAEVTLIHAEGRREVIGECSGLTVTETRPPRHVRRQRDRPAITGADKAGAITALAHGMAGNWNYDGQIVYQPLAESLPASHPRSGWVKNLRR